ncbi:uncharacterized protein LOC115884532 isoform X2 [Sitophilus oryzae]|uniref:Uncharacterized protein LOC115884532 isoform X2 n=1 Tax=Sitophilus oryzae TaxID=7048 RepID=A0A6J2Y7T1_SITOR|nr:uncharacterized protein LOC115884532 isoform X2 [Sitophilus oryzae]
MRPHQDLYWNTPDSDSEESLRDYHNIPLLPKQSYIDPWDLENYAYIREHLESMELSSSPSLPYDGSSGSGVDYGEANSTSFFYVPGGNSRLPDRERNSRLLDVSGDYADIDEVQYISRNMAGRRSSYYDLESPYEEGFPDNSVFGIYDKNGRVRRVTVPVAVNTTYKSQLDRSLSSSYGDSTDYDPYTSRHELYSRLDEMPKRTDRTMPIYDDVRRLRRKPNNFGLTNYGHLKIDYSISWNDLNKYIRYNS